MPQLRGNEPILGLNRKTVYKQGGGIEQEAQAALHSLK
jgi:hypothetical protein